MIKYDRRSKKYEAILKVPIEELKILLESSKSFTDFYKKFYKTVPGKNIRFKIFEYIKKCNINTDHFLGIRVSREKPRKYSNEELFTIDNIDRTKTILKRVKKDKLIDYVCQKCGNIGEWLDEKLTLHLDHINGNNKDNRLENLRFLCPNCHQQTETWGVAKSRRINITDEEFFEMSKTLCNYEIAKNLNINASTVSNRLSKFYRDENEK